MNQIRIAFLIWYQHNKIYQSLRKMEIFHIINKFNSNQRNVELGMYIMISWWIQSTNEVEIIHFISRCGRIKILLNSEIGWSISWTNHSLKSIGIFQQLRWVIIIKETLNTGLFQWYDRHSCFQKQWNISKSQ
jgi:hypothetical protein